MAKHKNKRPSPQIAAATQSPATRWIELLLLPSLLLIAIFFVTFRPISDPDTWFHMALGKWILQHHEIPRLDPFAGSSPAGEWISSGWLTSVIMELLFRAFGPSGVGLLLFSFMVVAAAYLLVWYAARRWFGDRGLIMLPLMIALGAATIRFNPRPDLFSHLLLACTLLILVLAERPSQHGRSFHPWYVYLLLPINIAWANLHAGYLVGILVLLIYAAWNVQRAVSHKARWRFSRLQPTLLPLLAILINPYGIKINELAAKIARIPKVDWILEWMPLLKSGFPLPIGTYLCAALLLIISIYILWRTRAEWWRWAVAALLVTLTLLQRRQIGPVSIGLCVLLLPSLPHLKSSPLRQPAILAPAAALLTVAICALKVAGFIGGGKGVPQRGIDCTQLPCVATEFLATHRPPPLMFNSYAFGGYLLYHLGPQTKVFIDGRLDVYDPKVYLDTLAVEENRLPIHELEQRYGVRSWVLSIEDAIGDAEHLASRLANQPGYALVHFDDQAAVFVKRSPDTAAYLDNEFRHVNPWKIDQVQAAHATDTEALFDEIDRALAQSGNSANAKALAALVASIAGEPQAARQLLAEAAARNPQNKLIPQVAARFSAP